MLRNRFVFVAVLSAPISCVGQIGAASSNCLQGSTIDVSGTGIDHVLVKVREVGQGTTYTAVSDSTGSFKVCGLPGGQYRLTAQHNVSGDSEEDAVVGESDPKQVTLRLKPATAERSLHLNDVQEDTAQTITRSLIKDDGSAQEIHLEASFLGSGGGVPDAPSSSRNLLHGQLYGLLGSNYLGAPDVAAGAQLPLSQFGGTLGGNFGSERTSFFVSYDQFGLNRQRLLSNLAGQVGTGKTGTLADANVLASSAFVSRVDHQFSQRDSGYLHYSRDEMHGNSLQRGQDARLPSSTTGLNLEQQSVGAANTVDLSGTTTNETRAQFTSTDVQLPAGAGAIGLQSTMPTERRNRVFEAANNVYRQIGSQNLRLGGDFLYNQMNISFLQSAMGRSAATGPSLSQSAEDAGLYIQSARQLRPGVLLTTGMRYDIQSMRGIKTDRNNFSPQLGFAWSPGSSRTVFRAGFGMNYDRTPLPLFAGSDDSAAANLSRSVTVSNLGSNSLANYGTFQTVSPTVQSSYAEHITLEAEQAIAKKSVLSAQYQYVRGVQLALPVQRTAALCASTNACAAGNDFTGQQIGSGDVSSYNGLTIAFTQQPVRWGNYKVAYTYSTAEGTGNGANASYLTDQMRRVSFTGVLHTSLAPASNAWQRITNGFLLAGTTDYLTRSEFLGMNFINLNARLTKNLVVSPRFRLEASAETFNMLQRTNSAFTKAVGEMGENASSVSQRTSELQRPKARMAPRLGFGSVSERYGAIRIYD